MEIVRGDEYKEKGSKFLGFFARLTNLVQFNEFLKIIKAEHPTADHCCPAYRFNEPQANFFGDKILHEKYYNDGECSGTGRALLNLLREQNLEDCGIIVVRYFGGILLGAENVPIAFAKAGAQTLSKLAK